MTLYMLLHCAAVSLYLLKCGITGKLTDNVS